MKVARALPLALVLNMMLGDIELEAGQRWLSCTSQ
jgi:hypothetical protein